MNFKEWLLLESSNPGSKTGLYPLSYGGIGLYPPQWYLTRSADAIFYLSIDDRIYKNNDSNIKHIPSSPTQKLNGEDGMWNIKHLKGKPSHPTQKNYAASYGEKEPWDISKIKGKPSYTKNKEFIPDPGEDGSWNIKKFK